MIDVEDFAVGFIIAFLVTLFLSLALVVVDGWVLHPLRAEDAQQQCIERGFDNYNNFKGFLRTEAYGVKCEFADYSKKQVDVGRTGTADNTIVVV